MMLKTFGLHCIFVLNAMRAFSATPFSRIFAVTPIFVFWPSKVVEPIPIHHVPNSHINIQLINQHIIYLKMLIFGNMAEKRFSA